MKSYNQLSDIEMGWVQEYREWCKCDIPALALEQATHYRKLLAKHGLDASDY